MFLRAAFFTAIITGVPTTAHFVVRAADHLDRAATAVVRDTTNDAIDGVAKALGYERPATPLEAHTLDDLAEKEALIAGINPALIRALIHVESRGKKFAESPVGAIGLTQIMPFNAKRCGLEHYSQLWEPHTNIKCGVQILSEELKTYKGNVTNALIAYNGGASAVNKQLPVCVGYAKDVLNKMAQDIR